MFSRRFTALLTAFLLVGIGLASQAQVSASTAKGSGDSIVASATIPSEPGRVKWRFRLDGDYSLHTPGVGADGTIYVGMSNGKLYAVSPAGVQRWVFQAGLGGGVFGPVSVGGDGTIYVAGMVRTPSGTGNTGAIFAINPDGTQRWRFEGTGDFIIAGPNLGPDGNLYAVTDFLGIGLFSLNPSGQLRFATGQFTEYGALGEGIAFGTDQLYFGFDMFGVGPARLFSYDLNGNFRFEAATGLSSAVQPEVGPNGNVVTETFPVGVGLSLTAYNPQGSQVWSFYEFPGNTQGHPDIGTDNTTYSVRNLSTLLALNAAGAERWRYADTGIMFEPIASPTNSLVFTGGRVNYGQPGFFLAFETSGVPLWRIDLPDEAGFEPYGQLVPFSRPVFSPDGTAAYTVTDVAGDGSSPSPYSFLYAIDTSSGAPAPTLPAAPSNLTASAVSSSQINPPGPTTPAARPASASSGAPAAAALASS